MPTKFWAGVVVVVVVISLCYPTEFRWSWLQATAAIIAILIRKEKAGLWISISNIKWYLDTQGCSEPGLCCEIPCKIQISLQILNQIRFVASSFICKIAAFSLCGTRYAQIDFQYCAAKVVKNEPAPSTIQSTPIKIVDARFCFDGRGPR